MHAAMAIVSATFHVEGACQGLELYSVSNVTDIDLNLKVEAADKDEEKRREKKKEGKEEGEGKGEGRGEKNSPVGAAEPSRAARRSRGRGLKNAQR